MYFRSVLAVAVVLFPGPAATFLSSSPFLASRPWVTTTMLQNSNSDASGNRTSTGEIVRIIREAGKVGNWRRALQIHAEHTRPLRGKEESFEAASEVVSSKFKEKEDEQPMTRVDSTAAEDAELVKS